MVGSAKPLFFNRGFFITTNRTMETDLRKEARSMHLSYVSDRQPGYTREVNGNSFVIYDALGKIVTDEDELNRIKALAIPPAWINVWICPKTTGHLQATGYDTAGRKQYKYHAKWSQNRNERKHNRMAEFAEALPLIRERIDNDLRGDEFTKEKVLALALSVLDKTHIRVGNETYTRLYGSFGLTSLRNRHIKIMGNKMIITFKGKKGVLQEVKLTHARLARMLKKLKDLPGQELFQYYDKEGCLRSIDSDSVNEYLYSITNKDFTAKDFRTWWGTVTALSEFANLASSDNVLHTKEVIITVLDTVAKQLGNTRAVCKKYYVHPTLLAYYEEGKLDKYINRLHKGNQGIEAGYLNSEEILIKEFIANECN
jgi:DNA topoisomerase-1